MEWSQPALPFAEPVTILPSDGRARLIFAWRGKKSGRLDRRWAAEVDDVSTVRRLLREQPDVYETQWWMDRPIHRHAFALCGTHAYADLDFYKVPALADQTPDAIGRALLRHCDDTGLPRPSAIIGSGRGLYPKWCFAEPVGREHVGTMVSVNRELTCQLAEFGADRTATDATRLLRATGTMHSGAGRMVEVLHLEQRDGRTITYDPHALAARIVPRAADAPAADVILATADDVHREARRDHHLARHRFTREGWHWALIEDMRALPAMRWHGIVPEGWRDTFAFLIACQVVRIFPPGEVPARSSPWCRPSSTPISSAGICCASAARPCSGRATRTPAGDPHVPLRQADDDRHAADHAGRDAPDAGADRRSRI